MLNPIASAIVIFVMTVLLLFIIPMLDGSKKFGRYISLRFTLVSVALMMALGCVLDFSHLAESSRNIVLIGGLALAGVFVIVRSLEKCKLGNKRFEIEVHKGDCGASAVLEGKDKETDNGKA